MSVKCFIFWGTSSHRSPYPPGFNVYPTGGRSQASWVEMKTPGAGSALETSYQSSRSDEARWLWSRCWCLGRWSLRGCCVTTSLTRRPGAHWSGPQLNCGSLCPPYWCGQWTRRSGLLCRLCPSTCYVRPANIRFISCRSSSSVWWPTLSATVVDLNWSRCNFSLNI